MSRAIIGESQRRTTGGLRPYSRQNESKEVKDNVPVINSRKINNLNTDINKLLRAINILFDFKDFQINKLQPLEKVS